MTLPTETSCTFVQSAWWRLLLALCSSPPRSLTPNRSTNWPRQASQRAEIYGLRADSASALRDFLAVPMSTCGGAPNAALVTSRLLASAGRDGDAARVLDRALPNVVTQLSAPMLMQERALVAERMGDRAKAREWYTRIVAQWADGDTPVHAVRDAAKASLARLR